MSITRRDLMAGAAGLAAAGALGVPRAFAPGHPDLHARGRAPRCACCAGCPSSRRGGGLERQHRGLHRRDRRAGAHRQGELGGHPAEGRGRRQRRLRPRHGDGLVRRPLPVSRQAGRRHRARRVSRRRERRLVRRPEGLRGARRQVHRHAALRHRQRHLLPREPHGGGGLLRVPERHGRLPRALQGAARQGHSRRLPARQGGRRRQQLRPLAALEPRRQDGRRGRHGRHQQPRDPRRDRIREGALRDLHPRHRELARHQQQPRLPRRRRCR